MKDCSYNTYLPSFVTSYDCHSNKLQPPRMAPNRTDEV